MKFPKNKTCFLKFSLTFLFALSVSLFPFQAKQASAWDAVLGAFAHRAIDTIYETIMGILVSAGKQAAVKALNQELSFMISGSTSGGAMFIVDWKDYLIDQPKMQARVILNSKLGDLTRGRGSLSGYISKGSSSLGLKLGQNYEGVGPGSFALGLTNNDPAYTRFSETARASGLNLNYNLSAVNYTSILKEIGEKVPEGDTRKVTYFKTPGTMYDTGTFRDQSVYLDTGAINTSSSFQDNAARIYEEEKTNLEKIAATEGAAGSGFIGKKEDGKTITPGAIVKDTLAKAQTMTMDIISNASKLPEIIATMLVTKAIESGIGTIQASVHKETSSARANVSAQIEAAKKEGPSALYNNDSTSR